MSKEEILRKLRQYAISGELTSTDILELIKLTIDIKEVKAEELRKQLRDTETALVASQSQAKTFGEMSKSEFIQSKLRPWKGKTYYNHD
jgi:hypothetical protein